MICAAANKYQNDIKTVSDTARRRQIAENCQKLQSVWWHVWDRISQ